MGGGGGIKFETYVTFPTFNWSRERMIYDAEYKYGRQLNIWKQGVSESIVNYS